MNTLVARQYYNVCYDSFGNPYRCNSAWNRWGRWLMLGLIIFAALLLFFLCSCLSARRRRAAGQQPLYGTGWAGRPPWGPAPAYNPNYATQQQYQTPPTYNQTAGGYYGQNQGYFGGRQTDVEMHPPQNVYRGGDNVYEPPQGAPPAKQ